MKENAATYTFSISCAIGLESIIKKELLSIGKKDFSLENGKIIYHGKLSDCIELNYKLRCAERIGILLKECLCKDFGILFDEVFAINWKNLLCENPNIIVTVSTKNSDLHSVPAIQSITKKAIITKLLENTNSDKIDEKTNISIHLEINNNNTRIILDTTGDALHKRGYRIKTGDAPLKETMAAALLLLANQEKYNVICDPFCGSGTIGIEAALIKNSIYPGINRCFDFEVLSVFDKDLINAIRSDLGITKNYNGIEVFTKGESKSNAIQNQIEEMGNKEKIKDSKVVKEKIEIVCSDIDSISIKNADENMKNAGVRQLIQLQKANALELDYSSLVKIGKGLIVSNPPYGIRIGEERKIKKLYQEFLRKVIASKVFDIALLTGFPEAKEIDILKNAKNRKLYNGKLCCYLFTIS